MHARIAAYCRAQSRRTHAAASRSRSTPRTPHRPSSTCTPAAPSPSRRSIAGQTLWSYMYSAGSGLSHRAERLPTLTAALAQSTAHVVRLAHRLVPPLALATPTHSHSRSLATQQHSCDGTPTAPPHATTPVENTGTRPRPPHSCPLLAAASNGDNNSASDLKLLR